MQNFIPITNKRVKTHSTSVQIGDELFLLQERSIMGIDDKIYEVSRNIWATLPRGDARIITKGSDGQDIIVGALVGVRKFGYLESAYGFEQKVKHVFGIEKENGECAHATVFLSPCGEIIWVVGSKHVNVMFRMEFWKQDLQQFEHDQTKYDKDPKNIPNNIRFTCALKIAHLFIRMMEQKKTNDLNQYNLTISLLLKNQWTINGEAIFADSQHIVDYNCADDLRWFALTTPNLAEDGLTVNPHIAQNVFLQCGLRMAETSQMFNYKSDEYNAFVTSVARRGGSEGVVMYGVDDAGTVVRMWKEKSYPYTMERIVREEIMKGSCGNELFDYVMMRLSKQPQIIREYFTEWENVRLPQLIKFAAFLQHDEIFLATYKINKGWNIRSQWITLQKACFSLHDEHLDALVSACKTRRLAGKNAFDVIVLVGPPGSGKSTLARSLVGLLKSTGSVPIWLNQDEAGGNKKKFLDAIKISTTNKNITHLIIDKSNMESANHEDYVSLGLTPTATFVFQHPNGDDELVKLCHSRIVARGDGHRSLKLDTVPNASNSETRVTHVKGGKESKTEKSEKMDDAKLLGIIQKFVDTASINAVLSDVSTTILDATLSMNCIVELAWSVLCQRDLADTIQQFGQLVKSCLADAVAYEINLKKFSEKPQFYSALKIKTPTDVLQLLTPESTIGKTNKSDFHITLKYFGGVIDHIFFNDCASKVGQPIKIHIIELVFDDQASAFRVEPTFMCDNLIPHVTASLAKDVKPVYSNDLLAKTDGIKRIPLDIWVDAEYCFM
jgi:ABC-type oligopeptide transport system ATPase subunit